jgi:hypothetical protein
VDYEQKFDEDICELFTEKLKSDKNFGRELYSALVCVKWYHKNDNNNTGYEKSRVEKFIASILDNGNINPSISNVSLHAYGGFVSKYISDAMAEKGWKYEAEANKFDKDICELFTKRLRSDKDFCKELWSALANVAWYYESDNGITTDDHSFRSASALISTIIGYGSDFYYLNFLNSCNLGTVSDYISAAMKTKGWQYGIFCSNTYFSKEEGISKKIDIKKKNIEMIVEHHRNLGYKSDEKGYLTANEENLLEMYPNWDEIKKELTEGDGDELKRKFRAVHSSSALCVNNFALVKQHKNNVSLFGETGFSETVFEKKFPTFLRNPVNLDFYLENDNSRIGIESKFTEILQPALPKEKNLEAYIDHKKLPEELRQSFNNVIKYYLDCKEKMHLDAAQLIKHLIALSLIADGNPDKTTKLIYLYWLPLNYRDMKIYQKHGDELETFKALIKDCRLPFESYSYFDLWDMALENEVLADILKKIKDRYKFTIKENYDWQ